MSKVKLCYIINSVKRCGPVNILISMIRGINRDKYDISLITLLNDNDLDFINEIKKLNLNIVCFNYNKNVKTFLKKNEIIERINRMGFDVVHVHGHITAMLVNEVNAKKIITVHNKMLEDFKNTYGFIIGMCINKFYINALKKFDEVICCSKSSYEKCKKYISNISYIRNGMYIELKKDTILIRQNIRKKLNIPIDAKVYIFAGNYCKIKNVIKMLEFFKKNLGEKEYLICLGTGKLFQKAQKYNSKNIIQLGFVDNVRDYMIASDIYTSFSITEGLPVSIIEALSSNLLLLLSDIDSHCEVINIDKNLYVGEVFNDKNFVSQKEKVSSSSINDSIVLQQQYLSEKSMMELYEKLY